MTKVLNTQEQMSEQTGDLLAAPQDWPRSVSSCHSSPPSSGPARLPKPAAAGLWA